MPTLIKPSAAQYLWQEAEFGIFIHFSINTFANKEWSDGTFSPQIYNPVKLDCNQWVTTAKNAGAKYMILVCKHHDGFCNWQTKTTDYSVKSSPWKNGKGDVVKEFVDACRKQQMRFGFYLSPWDRHEPKYKDKAAYDEFYCRQLEELITEYAHHDEIFELWFDGAGSTGREYDWPRIMALVHQHQPHAMIFNMGDLTIRWSGNEHGFANYPLWNVVKTSQKGEFNFGRGDPDGIGDMWIPAECDVPIRIRHWFHHKGLWGIIYRKSLLSKARLVEIYEKSIGRGGNLLLNLAPTTDGLFNQQDINRLNEMVAEVRRRYAQPLAETSGTGMELILKLGKEARVSAVITQEEIREGQRVKQYRIEANIAGTWTALTFKDPTLTIGHKKIDLLKEPVVTDSLRLIVEDAFADPLIRSFQAYTF
jgi:alpha-L-fucosidase